MKKNSKLGKDKPDLWGKAHAELKHMTDGRPTKYWRRVSYPQPISTKEIRQLRASLELSQLGFAQALGLSLGTIRSWEQGVKQPIGLAKKVIRASLKDAHVLESLAAA